MTVEIKCCANLNVCSKLYVSKKSQTVIVCTGSAVHLCLGVEVSIIHSCEVRLALCVYTTLNVKGCCRSELNSLVTKIEYASVLNSEAESGGYAIAVVNIKSDRVACYCERALSSKSRTVYGNTCHALGCVDYRNILKYNVLCAIDVDTCCKVVTVKSDVLKSNVIRIYTDKVSLILLQVERLRTCSKPSSIFISLDAVSLTVDSNTLGNYELTCYKYVIKKDDGIAFSCCTKSLSKSCIVVLTDLCNLTVCKVSNNNVVIYALNLNFI